MWLLPLIDQLTRDPGNMTLLIQNFSTPDEPYLAKGLVARATLTQLSLLGPWVTGPAVVERNLVAVVLTFALWAAAVSIAVLRRDRVALVAPCRPDVLRRDRAVLDGADLRELLRVHGSMVVGGDRPDRCRFGLDTAARQR